MASDNPCPCKSRSGSSPRRAWCCAQCRRSAGTQGRSARGAPLPNRRLPAHPESACAKERRTLASPVEANLSWKLWYVKYDMPFEILVGDDASTDQTPTSIEAIGGRVKLVRGQNKRGFLETCNRT